MYKTDRSPKHMQESRFINRGFIKILTLFTSHFIDLCRAVFVENCIAFS